MDEHEVHVVLTKIPVIHNWKSPTTLIELHGFFNVTKFYHMFLLCGAKAKFSWGASKQKSFEDLKRCLCLEPVLTMSNLQQPFEIERDASNYVIGTTLTQHGHLMSYHSETL